jgi:hypothetical protein
MTCAAYTNRCSACYNMHSHMFVWFLFTPSFHFAVLLVTQPLALLAALWGMTSRQTLVLMQESIAQGAEQ